MDLTSVASSADGWRGVIDESFTPSYAALVTHCVMRALAADRAPGTVLVTHDGRRGGERCAAAAVAAAADAGADRVRLVPHLPTPVVSAALRRGRADVAFLVTASHNPGSHNGLKVKVAPGRSLPAAVERRAEQLIGEVGGVPVGTAAEQPDRDAGTRWTDEHLADILDRLPAAVGSGATVVVDGVGGVAGGPMARLCERLGWRARLLGGTPDPGFGGLVPDPTLAATRRRAERAVREESARLGIVLDGDGDRVFVIDERGRTVQPHELLALLLQARWSLRRGDRDGDIAVTVATGTAVRTVARRQGRGVRETRIGFKHLSPLLADGRADLAGGSVGDLAFADHGIDRDPFTAVALLAELLHTTGRPLGDLLDALGDEVGRHRWFESRVPGTGGADLLRTAGSAALARAGLAGADPTITETDGVKFWLDDGQWLLLRRSTTEAGVRVYGELRSGPDSARRVDELLRSVRGVLTP
ncbi:phosphoglucomutase [Streptomyces sp. NBRC 110611]|uniref:phosphoglucomutase n=1 Tax=Streptomyces sp. NBRC 110611 TaxID=1621259 RepID=UPI0015EF666C|nr:phosphoglucomutase [Streptomyces sp. NBRC 110611]